MRIEIISFTAAGRALGQRTAAGLSQRGWETSLSVKSEYVKDTDVRRVEGSLSAWTGEAFAKADAILFIGACGIAVRSIAPYIRDKKQDPAVAVMDERGQFVIPLLSGHLGGANRLAGQIALLTGAVPVITTATDINGRFAVDVFAKDNGCGISDMRIAKEVSAALLAGDPVGFHSDFPWKSALPEGLISCREDEEQPEVGIAVTISPQKAFWQQTLFLTPRIVTVGLGCRRGADVESIARVIRTVCREAGVTPDALERAATIDIKRDEPGILACCEAHNLPLTTYTAEELDSAAGDFAESEFVRSRVGVGNVCERSAYLASGGGKIIHGKYAADGVTAALAVREWSVNFE